MHGGLGDWIMVKMSDVTIRRATTSDASHIGEAHRDSIRAVGPAYDPANVVEDWHEGLQPDAYIKAAAPVS